MDHIIKIETKRYENLCKGIKKCEIRYNDRDYQRGETIGFKTPAGISLNGVFRITHIHSGLGLQDGYVALSLMAHVEELPRAKDTDGGDHKTDVVGYNCGTTTA